MPADDDELVTLEVPAGEVRALAELGWTAARRWVEARAHLDALRDDAPVEDNRPDVRVSLTLPAETVDFLKGLTPGRAGTALERAGVILGNAVNNGAFDCTVEPVAPEAHDRPERRVFPLWPDESADKFVRPSVVVAVEKLAKGDRVAGREVAREPEYPSHYGPLVVVRVHWTDDTYSDAFPGSPVVLDGDQ